MSLFTIELYENKPLGAKTWPCYIEIHVIMRLYYKLTLNDMKLQPCYSLVASVLNYRAEVWGFMSAECVERVHRKFCKYMLNVKIYQPIIMQCITNLADIH